MILTMNAQQKSPTRRRMMDVGNDPLRKADRLITFAVRLQDEGKWQEAESLLNRAYRYMEDAGL